jgi:poly(3-hydroxybutyrate) depolymerase
LGKRNYSQKNRRRDGESRPRWPAIDSAFKALEDYTRALTESEVYMRGASVVVGWFGVSWLGLSACSSRADSGLGASTADAGATSTSNGGSPTTGSSTAGASSSGAPSNGGANDDNPSSAGASGVGTSAGGIPAGGGANVGGSPGAGGAMPTMACGSATWPPGGANAPQMLDVQDSTGAVASRQFYISLPASYDGSKPYPLVFAWHYAGGTASALIAPAYGGAFYGVQKGFPEAIYVAGQGLTDASSGMTGWPNTNGQDIAMTRAMLTWLESNYCVDQKRIMATGMSYGGIMSDTLACQMPDVFRAIGVMSGALFNFGANKCGAHPIAAWMTHGTADMTVAITGGEAARDQVLKDNGCGATTQPVEPSPCISYQGCTSGYPVVWCPVADEGHTIPTFAPSAIATFFEQF